MESNDPMPQPDPAPGDAPISAYDRVQMRPSSPEKESFSWKTLVFVALVAVGLTVGYTLLVGEQGAENDNFLVHLIESAPGFRADLATTRPNDAAEYVYGQLGWAVAPPDLPGLALVGVQITVIGEVGSGTTNGAPVEVVVPAYRYEGETGESAVIYAYDYIVLDRVRASFDLPEATYAVLGEPTPVDTRRIDDVYLVTWRQRALIFTAVTDSEAVFERIGQTVAS